MEAPTALTPGLVLSTASRAAAGPRSTSSERRLWSDSRATSVRAGPGNPPTPGTSPDSPRSDYGGVLADQRTPEKEVLDAMRRVPDTGFAIHDAPSRVEQVLKEQAELRDVLRQRPQDVQSALRQAEHAARNAEQELSGADYRLGHAEHRLERLGPLSQLRHHGRQEKASALDAIDRFTGDVHRAEAKIARCQDDLGDLRSRRDDRTEWDVEHGWPDQRLRTVDAELRALTQPARDPQLERPMHLAQLIPDAGDPLLDRIAEIVRPPLPGHDHGIDLVPSRCLGLRKR
jgi:hypothetical protein